MGEASSNTLSDSFLKLGLKLGRLKTGTPPRLEPKSIHWDRMSVQPGDSELLRFSFKTQPHQRYLDQVPCYLTNTTTDTHRIILDNLDKSPMYTGLIDGSGPRYCPSIEDKVVRFKDKPSHQLFMEPETRNQKQFMRKD